MAYHTAYDTVYHTAYCQGRIKWARGPGQSRDREAP